MYFIKYTRLSLVYIWKKINLKLTDLNSTVNENKKELIRLDSELQIDYSEFENINKEICESLNPK